jgi:hypothetical protein
VGWGAHFANNFSQGFHNFGLLWTPADMVFAVDREPVAAAVIDHTVKGPAIVRVSSAISGSAGKTPDHPEGHDMFVKSVRVFAL